MARADLELVADRRLRRCADRRRDRARAVAPLHPRVTPHLDAQGRADVRRRRSSRCSTASCCVARTGSCRGACGCSRWTSTPRAGSPTATWSWSGTAPTRSGWRSSSEPRCSISPTTAPDATRCSSAPATEAPRSSARPLDSYVSGRMITLAAPCSALMESDPLTVTPDYLLADISEQIKEIHYGAAVAIDGDQPSGRPDHALGPRRSAAPARAARRPRRAGPERRRDRASRDRRDPRPPPHRLDRDARAGHGDVRSRRVDARRSSSSASARTGSSRAGRPR